jgi:WD40 repeat protein
MIATATIVGIQLYDLSAGPPFKNKLITKFVAWEMIKISPTEFVALEFKSSKIIIIDWKAERVSEPVSLGDFSTLDYGHNVMAYLGNNELAIAQSGTVPGIGIYNVRTGKRIQIIGSVPLSGTSIAVIDADKLALGNSNSNIVGIYSRTTGSQIAQTGPSAGNHVNALRVVENYLFVGTSGSSTTMYNLESQKRIHEFDQRDWIRSIVYLGDGMIATTSDDTTLRIWDIHTGKNLNDKEMFPHNWWTLTFEIINETMFASGQYDGTVKIWNYKSNISTEMADK